MTREIKLTSAEVGKLWATYMGNSMSVQVLSYLIRHCSDQDIKKIVEHALELSQGFVQTITQIFAAENHPIPKGFTSEDVNVDAPKLFEDEFLLYYLKYVGKAGISVYGVAVPLMTTPEVRDFFNNCLSSTVNLMNQVTDKLLSSGLVVKPPFIPIPERIDFVKKQSYLNGFFGNVRPLQSLEIAHLYDNIVNNVTSKAVLIGFRQVAQLQQARDLFNRGEKIASKHFELLSEFLQKEHLSNPPLLDHLVTASTKPPFSDKLMLYHKLDMFTMRIRSYGNALAFCARHDVAARYARFTAEVGNYCEDLANNLIEQEWMEQPPQAADREALVLQE